MTRASSAKDGCRQAEGLALKEAAGERLSAAERGSLEAHRAECPGCLALVAAAELLRDDDDEGVGASPDDLEAQRMVNDVVAQLAREDVLAATAIPKRHGLGRRYRLAAAAAVLLLVGAGLAVAGTWLVQRPGDPGAAKLDTARQPVARVHLSAGRVQVDDAPAEVGLAVRSGQTLRVTAGRATLGLPGATAVLLESDTTLHMDRLTPRATTVRLERGKLLASVRPRPGRPHFTVVTAAGRVEVTGTVFSVEHTPRGVVVAVLRGQVRVHERGRPARLVGRGMRTVMRGASGPERSTGREVTRPLDAAALTEAWDRVRVLELVHAKHAAKVTLLSRPAGALVFVDGLLLGQTPLVTRLRAGHHRVVLRKVGHRLASKQMHVAPGSDSTWDATLASAFLSQRTGVSPQPNPAPSPSRTPVRAPRLKPRGPEPKTPDKIPPAAKEPTTPVAPTAKTLAQRARQQRNRRDWKGAVKTFADLIRRYPGSGWARTARVSLGLILLDRLGNARGALAQFSAYLAANRVGALAQEASYGRLRALRRLGRRAAEIRELRAFGRLYPRAIQVTNVRRRLRQLGVKPPPLVMQHMGLGGMGGMTGVK